MASVNKWIGIGNLGRDPDTRYMPDGTAVTNLSIACTDSWKDKSTGEKQERTEWVRIVIFGRLAEVASEHLKKGSSVYFEGKLQTRKWTDKDGVEKYTTEIVAERMQMLGSKRDSEDSGRDGIVKDRQAPAKASAGGIQDMDSDIPFDRIGRGMTHHAL